MTRDQKIVAMGAASGVLSMIAAVFVIYNLWPVPSGLPGVGERIGYAMKGLTLAVLPLLIMVITVGNNRFLSEAIDPTLQKEDRATVINGRVTENTIQQFILLTINLLALASILSSEQMRIVPAAVIVFFVARFAFWFGYRIDPLYRAFGMSSTLYLNVGMLAYAIWRCVS